MLSQLKITTQEAIQLGAADPLFFAGYFFPKAARQRPPPFHREIWELLVSAENRYIAIEVFRGGAKTTVLRMFTAMQIAYGFSRTIMYISDSQTHAVKSLEWLKRAVEYNDPFAKTFGLRKGKKWSEEDIEIVHGVEGHTVRIVASGITGQNRGLNIDDYRPDLIIVDDPCNEENTATQESRLKTTNLFFGAVGKSLAPASEAPHAKIVLLQTPLHRDDLVEACMKDRQWASVRFGCFDEHGESRWPERWSTKELMDDKAAHIERNQRALWLREMECQLVAPELNAFRVEWLQYWDILPERNQMQVYMAIDPAPPLSEEARLKGRQNDYQAVAVIGVFRGDVYLLEYAIAQDQNPEELAVEFFRLAEKWKPRVIRVETIAYQQTLAWYLKQKMRELNKHFYIEEWKDRRKKQDRIRQAFTGRASNGGLYVHRQHIEFIDQFADYPDVRHDDLLDAVAMAVDAAGPSAMAGDLEAEFTRLADEEKNIPDMDEWRSCF